MRTYTYPQLAAVLGVSAQTLYRWFPARRGGLIREADVLRELNAHRMNGQRRLCALPDRLYRKDTLAEWLTANTARRRTANTVNEWIKQGAPHFKMNRAVLMDLHSMEDWADAQRNPFRRSSLAAGNAGDAEP